MKLSSTYPTPLTRPETTSQAASLRPGGLDFGPLLAQAVRASDGATIAQIARIIALQNEAKLGSDESSPSTESLTDSLEKTLALAGNRLPPPQIPAPMQPPPAAREAAPAAPATPKAAPHRQEIDDLINRAASQHGVDPNLVRAVVTAESDFDPHSHSQAGAMGLMQLMPGTAQDLGVTDPFDPAQNIDGGTRYLAQLMRRFGGDEDKALAAYNWGPANVERGGGQPAETRDYLRKVRRYKQLYAGGYSTMA